MAAKKPAKKAAKKTDDRRGGARPGAGRPPKDRPAPTAPHLEAAIRSARTVRALQAVLAEIGAGVASGKIDRLLGETLERIVARAEKLLKARRAERVTAGLRAIEVLTPAEGEVLERYRASVRPTPLGPGVETPGPPEAPPGVLGASGATAPEPAPAIEGPATPPSPTPPVEGPPASA